MKYRAGSRFLFQLFEASLGFIYTAAIVLLAASTMRLTPRSVSSRVPAIVQLDAPLLPALRSPPRRFRREINSRENNKKKKGGKKGRRVERRCADRE